ncbi:unnamed protein product [Closterium sp. Naga37s-1]|nr:unnamed protein product [Closterium sp. Naga37s-1]
MSAAEEENIAESGDDLLVDDLPEGLLDDLASSPDHPAAKKPCMDPGAGPASFNSPSTSSDSALAQPAPSPVLLAAAAAPTLTQQGHAPSLAATAAAPNAPVLRAAAYATAASGANPAPALPASLFASSAPGGPPRNLRRARTSAATPMLLPLRRRVVVTLLLPEAVLESHRTEILAEINAQLCGFMFDSGIIPPFEHTVGDSLRVARHVYGRLLFSWPSQEDAAVFRKLFPLMLKISNSRPVMLKVFVDWYEAFTAAKAAGAPTLSIRNVPLEIDPEEIRAFLLGSTEEDGSHWLADLTDFHRASDPYENTFFTHLAGLPVATPDDPNFERIPSEFLLEENKPTMLLNFSCHVCTLCGNNHRAPDHETFAARRRGRLTNKNTISIAQLQQANAPHPPAPHVVGLPLNPFSPPRHPPLPALSNTCRQAPAQGRSAPVTSVPSSPPPTVGPPPTLTTPPSSHTPHAISASRNLFLTHDPPPPAPTHVNPTPHYTPAPSPSEDSTPPSHKLAPHPHPPPTSRLDPPTVPPSLPPPDTPPTISPEGGPPAQPYAGMETLLSPCPIPPFSTSTPLCSPDPPTSPPHFLSPDSPPPPPYPQSRLPPPHSFQPPLHFLHPPPSQEPICNRPLCYNRAARSPPRLPPSANSPLPPASPSLLSSRPIQPPLAPSPPPAWAPEHPCPSPAPPTPLCTSLHPQPTRPHGNSLGNHAAPTAFGNDPSLLYIGLGDWVEYWTCALCDFTCGAALDSAMEHIQSDLHVNRVKASAHRPTAKEEFGPWRALTLLQQKAPVAAFLRGRP